MPDPGFTLTCSLCETTYRVLEVRHRAGPTFCPACMHDRPDDCLARMKRGSTGRRLLFGFLAAFALCGSLFLLAARFGYIPGDWNPFGAPAALRKTAAGSPRRIAIPFLYDNAPAKAEATPLSSVEDAGNTHLLYVTAPGTDACVGVASRLYVTREAPSSEPARLVSKVGDDMAASFADGLRYVQKQPRSWEKRFSIRLSFEDRGTPKDGGSAGAAFTVAMLAAMKGLALDPDAAITGDLTVDGAVQPVGGVVEKLRGAIASHCKVTLIPVRNARDLLDMTLLDGSAPLWETQIFTIGTVDEALSLARVDRPRGAKAAIARFNQLRARLPAVVTPNYLLSPVVQSELKEILRLAPNHLTAATLLRAAGNHLPVELSLNRSVETILDASYLFVASVISPEPKSRNSSQDGITVFPEKEFIKCCNQLQNVTPILDKRSLPLKAACLGYGWALRAAVSFRAGYPRGPESNRDLREMAIKDAAAMRDMNDSLSDARSNLLLALRKLKTDGDLTAEMLYK